MPSNPAHLSLNEVFDAQAKLSRWALGRLPRVLLAAFAFGMVAAAAFVSATWLLSTFQRLSVPAAYWLAGTFAFMFFALWPVIEFTKEFLFHRQALASLAARIGGGEPVPRPPTPLFSPGDESLRRNR